MYQLFVEQIKCHTVIGKLVTKDNLPMNKQIIIRSSITAINNTVCIVALVAVYLTKEIEFEERAIYGMTAVLVWLAVQRIISKAFPKI